MTIEIDGVNNTLKTDKIEPQSGTALQVGASGDTITLPSGATLNIAGTISNSGTATGFGAVDWQTSDVKTSNFTAVAGKGYFVNTTGGAITVNLPAGSAGSIIALVDYAGTWDTNKCTISANGSEKIQGSTDDGTLERDREAVNLIYVDSTQGWVVTSVSDQGITQKAYIVATGGTITTSGDYKIHTFTGDGTFNVTAIGNAAGGGALTSYVVVAGGGGGGTTNPGGAGGGGGSGGFREGKASGDPYSASPLNAPAGLTVSVQPYTITVGGGGTPNSSPGRHFGGAGDTSTFSTISSAGGGGGGASCSGNPPTAGRPGGSGGGGGFGPGPAAGGGSGNTPPVSPPQGNNGGAGEDGGTVSAGGGGGAGAAGATAVYPGTPGAGGNGVASSITGSPVTRAGGGGGASETQPSGAGGSGGGGAGRFHASGPGPDAGTANTGGGGGGAYCGTGGNGGPGVVIIRYKYQN